ncbi:MAG TPA: D-alanyl-D-alanine carboxypeptidase family protein [Pyrinomonadaceae bacterium]|nr:D-alanyl-D-alanine carboxypeptidase family protein [Pyrinomonadaceae bacterium]
MKKRVLLPAATVSLFSCLVVYTLLVNFDVYAQERSRVAGPLVRQTASIMKVERNNNSSAFKRAAAENARLRNSLSWTFSGKTQTGWNIYVPLISQAMGVDAGPDTPEFALALSNWQANAGLPETGVLDEATLETFKKYWQSRRLGRFGLSSEDNLLSAPIAEFFDPTRSTDMLQLERDTYAAYKKMVAAATKDLQHELKLTKDGELAPEEKFLRIVSAYRSQDYQDALRKKEPNAGRGALAKNSPHSTGHAIDIYVGGEPVKTLDSNRLIQVQTPAYKWLMKNAHRFGFYNYFYEPWHWEYVPGK